MHNAYTHATMVAETATKSEPERKMSASARIKILLIERGMTARELASRLGLSKAYTYQLIGGSCTTKAGRQRISDYFGEEFWPGIVPASRTSTPHARGAVEQVTRPADRNGCDLVGNQQQKPGTYDEELRTGANGPEPPEQTG
jgi:transcriptional regulator with XRE-family HTH domain